MRNKKIWTGILFVVVLGIIIYFVWSQLTSGQKYEQISLTALADKLKEAAANEGDDKYFIGINVNQFENTIIGSFNDGQLGLKTFQTYGSLSLLKIVLGGSDTQSSELINNSFLGANSEVLSKTSESLIGLSSVKTPSQSMWGSFFISLVPTLILIGAIVLLTRYQMRSMNGQGGGAFGDKSPAQIIKSDKKFSDVAGNKEPIEEISEIVDYLKFPKKYEESGARMPRGILLGGPPGTGKTLLAKATAGEANVPFYFVSASSFVELFVGMGAKRVRQVIAEARKNSPAIVFIDELDAIGRTRGSGIGGGHDEREQTLNQLLVEMDGIKENSGLLFVAATNRTDVLDPALTRPGRFDRVITVGLPDVSERAEILKLHAKGKRFSPDIDFKNIAKRTPGFSGAQLENVINESVLLSIREKTNLITLSIIDEAIDRVMAGPAKKSRTITKEELTSVAYHEAGHAVVGLKTPGGNKVQKITIIPRGQAGGYNLMMPENEKYNYSKEELLASIASFMGGRAAEEIIYGKNKISTGASDDIEKATNIARRMVTEFGMSDLGPIKYQSEEGSPFLGKTLATNSSLSNQISHEIDLEIRKIILEAQNHAHKIINENMELLELIKTSLLEKETIIAEEIDYIAKNLKLPETVSEESINEENTLSLDELIKTTSDRSEDNNN
ncbi:ATP-dependent zinc metalloprotease FtsH [Mycoplasma sp. CSL10137]|uniref:ATP-dependent zinc metalloprotease FtsH n=1 Tax=unclassified Mycoplasma TaxID=2683645 RepID=UPI00197B602C|nr:MULTISPECIES: ATP-dependent zinc metalloprotease FtsH [unclassified Mycoplasma]MBN4083646.1 ATP-dependent zinc metalloprotease FtsH [Mycoplasma sp. CSL10137]MBN4084069.1 ATP-dependent zinc metalloprotease FtsH [Mycoplasma sp. CSL10166]MBU4693268.1 ATP-dependent zinc metalloprotease FtsH [Mycoplasma sp. CSL7491-lung]